jgi:hypothetical protein
MTIHVSYVHGGEERLRCFEVDGRGELVPSSCPERAPDVPPEGGPGVLAQAASWLRAEASLALEGPLPADRIEARLAQCRSCPRLEPLPAPQVGWCTACGCPRSGRAELTVKATMPAARCPEGRWAW